MGMSIKLPEINIKQEEVKVLLAIKLLEDGLVSLGKAAEIAGYSEKAFSEILLHKGVAPIKYVDLDPVRGESPTTAGNKQGGAEMETLKQEAIKAISKLPDTARIDDIMYELYVIDQINKGREAAERGDTISVEELKKEMLTW